MELLALVEKYISSKVGKLVGSIVYDYWTLNGS